MNRLEDRDIQTNVKMGLDKVRFAMESLVIYKQLLDEDILKNLNLLLTHLGRKDADIFYSTNLYSTLCSGLFNTGAGLREYIIENILYSENAFTREAEIKGSACLEGSMKNAVTNDLDNLQIIASLRPDKLKEWILTFCPTSEWQKEAVKNLPSWSCAQADTDPSSEDVYAEYNSCFVRNLLLKSKYWNECTGALAEFHHQWGSGIFAKYRAITWKNGDDEGYFSGVDSPDPVTFADMISYEEEREAVVENTLQFLEGYPANNVLLYGDRGTGKSSTVKALLNEHYAKGLRVIEVPKKLLSDFPIIVKQLSGRNLKFILFVDDLAFENNEERYTALKAALEGGLEVKPKNVLIYATSNRKHLIKEKFSDRAGLLSGNIDEEVHSGDTIQEKLSLSDRFGMTVVFSSPDKKRYLEIVEGIIRNRGLHVDREFLHSEALKWELNYNGKSPRTARQFADWLEGCLANIQSKK